MSNITFNSAAESAVTDENSSSNNRPEAILRNVSYLSWGSAQAKRYGFHFRVPEPNDVLR